jgi:hypothetical protein
MVTPYPEQLKIIKEWPADITGEKFVQTSDGTIWKTINCTSTTTGEYRGIIVNGSVKKI